MALVIGGLVICIGAVEHYANNAQRHNHPKDGFPVLGEPSENLHFTSPPMLNGARVRRDAAPFWSRAASHYNAIQIWILGIGGLLRPLTVDDSVLAMGRPHQ